MEHEKFMRKALELAEEAYSIGEVPYGSLMLE
jgi:tRNA(Arg) A34 adenosine deaminase TadA